MSDEDLYSVIAYLRPDGSPIRYPMLKLTAFDDEELAAVWAYLQTVPKIENAVARVE